MVQDVEGRIKYAAGFAFGEECFRNRDRTGTLAGRVVLIRKRPKVHNAEVIATASAGLYNGVGGHLEPGEDSYGTMRREFREEAGVDHQGWRLFCRVQDHIYNGACDFFMTTSDQVVEAARTMTDEPVSILRLEEMPWTECFYDLRWLIPMALDSVLMDTDAITTISR